MCKETKMALTVRARLLWVTYLCTCYCKSLVLHFAVARLFLPNPSVKIVQVKNINHM